MTEQEAEIQKLKASLAAIHFHSGKFSVRYWWLVPRSFLAATLKAIHDECEFAIPCVKCINDEVTKQEAKREITS